MVRSFDQVAARYDATRPMPPEATAAIAAGVQRLVAATPATTFLDVGIGTGRVALPLVRAGYRYAGVDLSHAMLRAAQQKVAGEAQRLLLTRADARYLPFGAGTFDVGLVVHVLHLIPDWPTALAELLRAIRPGGFFVYGFEHSAGGGGIREFGQRWRAVLAGHGVALRNHNAVDAEVLAALRERGLELETALLAAWETAATPEELLAGYASRAYSSSWSIPDAIFTEAVRELTDWVRGRFLDQAERLTAELRFSVTVARC